MFYSLLVAVANGLLIFGYVLSRRVKPMVHNCRKATVYFFLYVGTIVVVLVASGITRYVLPLQSSLQRHMATAAAVASLVVLIAVLIGVLPRLRFFDRFSRTLRESDALWPMQLYALLEDYIRFYPKAEVVVVELAPETVKIIVNGVHVAQSALSQTAANFFTFALEQAEGVEARLSYEQKLQGLVFYSTGRGKVPGLRRLT